MAGRPKKIKKHEDDLTNMFAKVEETHWWFIGRRLVISQVLKRFAPKKKQTMLDIGCGTGGTLRHLLPYGKAYGVDYSQLCVSYCLRSGLKNVSKAEARHLPYKDKLFDVVFMLDVLEHIKQEDKAIDEALRVLKDHGLLVFTLPALPIIYADHDADQGHVKRYLAGDIKAIVKRHNLQLVRLSYFNFFFAIPIALMRIASRYQFMKRFNRYESSVNLNTVKYGFINTLLTKIFTAEITLSEKIPYPFGISLLAVIRKP